MAAEPVGNMLEYGQFPFWNPYPGGGNILFHHPEVAIVSPFLLLYLIFGEGSQQVVMIYRAPYIYHGSVISLIFIIVTALVLIFVRRLKPG